MRIGNTKCLELLNLMCGSVFQNQISEEYSDIRVATRRVFQCSRFSHVLICDVLLTKGDKDCTILLEGSSQDVEEVRQEIEALVREKANEKEREITVENRFFGNIIGPKGQNIQVLREKYQVCICFCEFLEHKQVNID